MNSPANMHPMGPDVEQALITALREIVQVLPTADVCGNNDAALAGASDRQGGLWDHMRDLHGAGLESIFPILAKEIFEAIQASDMETASG